MYNQSIMVGNTTSLMLSSNQLIMSSREIAELTGKEHKNVIRDINNMIESLKLDGPDLSHEINQSVTYERDTRGYISNILLIKKYVECLLTGYSIPLRMKVIDRMHQLEDNLFKLPKTLPEALRAYADECEKNAQLENKIQEDAPKVAFVDNYVTSHNSKSLRETAKILKMSEKSLIEALIRDKILFRQSGNLLPYSRPSIKAYFTVKTGSAENGHAYSQTRVTAEGISWIASRYASELMVN